MRRFIIRAACACALLAGLAGAPWRSAPPQGWMPPPPEQRCPSVWGAADERGAANLQTAESVLAAARLIRDGKTYELGKVLDGTGPDFCAPRPAHLGAERPQPAGRQRGDRLYRARPDGHAVRRARAPAARAVSL